MEDVVNVKLGALLEPRSISRAPSERRPTWARNLHYERGIAYS
jgi:hypothetical protein